MKHMIKTKGREYWRRTVRRFRLTMDKNSTNIRNMIPRLIQKNVISALKGTRKVVLLFGARQVGKTTLVHAIEEVLRLEAKTFYLNCDTEEDLALVNTTSLVALQKLTSGVDYLFLDEAQRLDDPGLTLKIIHDQIPGVRVLATGSSSFDLKNRSSETLTGRFLDFVLYPLSLREILAGAEEEAHAAVLSQRAVSMLSDLMLYGAYPEIYTEKQYATKKTLLSKMTESYLLKDALSFQRVRQPQAVTNLTRALAYQIGSEVNENELATRLKIDRKTVVSYLDVLEKAFVIVRLYPYSRNPRREIGRRYKVYFVDVGIRNALINDFHDLDVRADTGTLWENFLVVERMKCAGGKRMYFWRNYGGAEVDYLEEGEAGTLTAFELKYGSGKLSRGASSFTKDYGARVQLINKENFLEFV